MAETAADQKAPMVLLDVFGETTLVQIPADGGLPEICRTALTGHSGHLIKITAGVLLEEDRSRDPDAMCKITMHGRITFRDPTGQAGKGSHADATEKSTARAQSV